jgi:dihydroorotase
MFSIGTDGKDQPLKITMLKPSDMHQHLRDGAMLSLVAPMVAKRFAHAIVMPNTTPPMTNRTMVSEYRKRIIKATGSLAFTPLMTFYLTDNLTSFEVHESLMKKHIYGIKYYPRGLTTNSDSGVENPASLWTKGTKPYECLRALKAGGGVLLLHAADGFNAKGEELDPYDQELHFIRNTLPRIIAAHPELKISVEHMSTAEGAEFMRLNGNAYLGCSLTAHHLLLDRRDVFRGGFRTHKHWWPIIQPREHKEELRRFAAQGLPFVWLGSDSAPHQIGKKESDCCIGGVLMAHAGIELYAEAFEQMNALDRRFENFASVNGPVFFGLPVRDEHITLVKQPWKVTQPFHCVESSDRPMTPSDDTKVVPFRLGEDVQWRLAA